MSLPSSDKMAEEEGKQYRAYASQDGEKKNEDLGLVYLLLVNNIFRSNLERHEFGQPFAEIVGGTASPIENK